MNNTKKVQLKIIAANVNSIATNERRHNLVQLLKKEDPDFALLSETKLKPFHKPKFKNYNLIRKDRSPANGGGVALLIKKQIKFEQISINRNLAVLEIVAVRIRLQSGSSLVIVSAYAPGAEATEFISELECIFKSLSLDSLNNYFGIAGDLNAKHTAWNNPYYNGRGLALFNWVTDNNRDFRIALRGTNVPTYPRTNSYIDIGLTDSRLQTCNLNPDGTIKTIDIDSDHRAICIHFMLPKIEDQIALSVPHNPYNYNKTDWEAFQTELVSNNDIIIPQTRNLSNTEIDKDLTDIGNNISKAMEKQYRNSLTITPRTHMLTLELDTFLKQKAS